MVDEDAKRPQNTPLSIVLKKVGGHIVSAIFTGANGKTGRQSDYRLRGKAGGSWVPCWISQAGCLLDFKEQTQVSSGVSASGAQRN